MLVETNIEVLVEQHQAGVWRYLRLIGCDDATADDLTQETFLALYRISFEDRGSVSTAAFLRRKARYLYLDRVRRRVRRREVRLVDAADTVWAEIAAGDDGVAYRAALEECLDTLASRSRQAIDLRYEQKRSRDEMAKTLGLGVNGVKTLLQRVRATLRECVEKRIGS
jgi:RNA polymerase sigma-70 factor, ECF subfamily